MSSTGLTGPLPRTQALHRALQGAASKAVVADLLLLEAWEANRSMDLGIMLRVRQIRRANQYLSSLLQNYTDDVNFRVISLQLGETPASA
jgi:hypothetical protein